MSVGSLLLQLKEVCILITHEAKDPRLSASEVFGYLKVINSAAQLGFGLEGRVQREGMHETAFDVMRFVAVAVETVLKTRQKLKDRESDQDPLSSAWDDEQELNSS